MGFVEIKEQAEKIWNDLHSDGKPLITVGTATCGRSAGAMPVLKTLKEETKNRNIAANIFEVGCMGPCYAEPLVSIAKPGQPAVIYRNVTSEMAVEIIENYLLGNDPMPQYVLGTVGEGRIEGIRVLSESPAFLPQERRVFKNCGVVDPTNIDHYIAIGGYSGLVKALDMTPQQIVDEVKKSGLRGRGGGGFPAGRKWESCLVIDDPVKFVVCNADEGDPGAFMDRSVLEGDPHALLEGMTIAGYAVGAIRGYIYCRAEYPLAIERLQIAIKQSHEKGLLGKNIMGTGFDYDIEIFQGAGAFVCGESTALTLSIEGKRGWPKVAPRPRTTEVGIYDKPTLLNNVKTFAFTPLILNNGADWFASVGTKESTGTAVFALTGKVVNCGLIEVPMGITLREIIYEVGGGIADGKKFKAVQTGGPSGGCLPEDLLDTEVDYDSLNAAGSIMGSGGMVVMDESTCMVDVARYFLDFTEKESCGQCVPCRLGTKQALDILEDICAGKGRPGDIDFLIELGEAIHAGSVCGLGQTAANPVLSTIRYFKDEYIAHIEEHRCPAMVCKNLYHYELTPDRCAVCHRCLWACPSRAITGYSMGVPVIDQTRCTKCGTCMTVCPARISPILKVPGMQVAGETEPQVAEEVTVNG